MNRSDYEHKILEQLRNPMCYDKLNQNPLWALTTTINRHLKIWHQRCLLNYDEYLYLKVDRPRYPCLYTLPKIHKNLPFPPGRPIVSSIGGPTERLSEYVYIFLQPLVINLPSYIKDTKHILSLITDVSWEQGMMLLTMDVVSLYTSIRHDTGIQALK